MGNGKTLIEDRYCAFEYRVEGTSAGFLVNFTPKMETFDHRKIDIKWQKKWKKVKPYRAVDLSRRKKQYVLIEFPYPSGERLHVGHGRSYCCFDAVARLRRMQGHNVLFPMGWDAFGLPAENYALRTGVHPSITTKKNIANAKEQVESWGLSFDWEREINTTDPDYYRWTQWIFLQLFKKGLAYKAEIPVNWCPSCKINLANEEVVQGSCERCGTPVTRRMQNQWMLKITAYADRLLKDLDSVDYREDIKQQQVNWIGRSEGARIRFKAFDPSSGRGFQSSKFKDGFIETFTTRPDTLFGATFLALAPEHPFVASLLSSKFKGRDHKIASFGSAKVESSKLKRVESYVDQALKKSELQRQEEIKEKTGVFTGVYAQHPITGKKVPIWVSDIVLMAYGTGAVMGVPAHDQRDFEFAKKFNLPVKEVIRNKAESDFPKEAFVGEGKLVGSGNFTDLRSEEARAKITAWLKRKGLGRSAVDYKLRDWVFSRQHYWGEPIPIVYCRGCFESKKQKAKSEKLREGSGYVVIDGEEHAIVPVPEGDLPVKLPYVKKYEPTGTGESPLAAIEEWVEVACPVCGGTARRETDTMPNWAGSSWYFLRYIDPKNRKQFADRRKLKYWMPVDWYNGGMEHTTLHLLYSRFWYKVLYDLGLVSTPEPYAKRTSHGVVLGSDGYRMSKSRGNVINPGEVLEEFGADTFRMYEAFMGPFNQMISWDPKGVLGVRRFLDRVWRAHQIASSKWQVASGEGKKSTSHTPQATRRRLHRLIKKIEEDTLSLKFNTAVSAFMEFINHLSGDGYQLAKRDWEVYLRTLSPYAPHLTEELWEDLGKKGSIHLQSWPRYDPKLVTEEIVTVVIQVDGKLRGKIGVSAGVKEAEVVKAAQGLETVKSHLRGKKVAKTIFIPDNLVNFVTK